MNLYYSTDQTSFDVAQIHEFLKEAYWSKNIPFEVVKQAIANSFCMVVFADERQVGFARLITDYATFAYLADVFVLEPYRNQGIGKALLVQLMQQVETMNLRRVLLATRDAQELYARYGFSALSKPQNFMEINHPDIYADDQYSNI